MAWPGSLPTVGVEVMPTGWPNQVKNITDTTAKGGGRTTLASATSANELTLPNTIDRVFKVTGTTTIYRIDSTDREPGNEIVLMFESAISIKQGETTATDPKFLPIYYDGTGTLAAKSINQRSNLRFVNEGTYWSTDLNYSS